MIRKLILISALLLWGIMSYAQQHRIEVFDADTKVPVSYAYINLANPASNTSNEHVASADGFLLTDLEFPTIITVKSIGYKQYKERISSLEGNTYTVYLKQDILNLDELVVTATRTGKSLKDVPVITRVVTAREIENKGIDNIQSLLESSLPGIEFQRHGTSQDVDVQGLGGRNILVLIDGERLAGETRGNVDYERINTADIQKVEIVKGASSALYGSQAMGAVINIITKSNQEKVYAEVSSEIKTMSERNFTDISPQDQHSELKRNLDRSNSEYNLLFGFNLKSWKAKTVINWKNTDGYNLYDSDSLSKKYIDYDTIINNPKNTRPLGIEGGKQFSVSQKLSYIFNKNLKAEADVKYYKRHKYDFYKEDKKHDYFDDFGYGVKLFYDNKKNATAVFSLSSDIYNKYDYKERLYKADLNYKDRFLNPKAVFTYQLKNHQLLVGTEFLRKALTTDMFEYGELIDKTSNTYTVFLQDDIKWNDRISMVVGARGQYNSAFHFQFTPKISLMYALKDWRLRANYAMGYRAPGLKELYMNWNHLDMFMIEGNPNLLPETNHYTSVSAEYTKNNFNASFSVFSNIFKNKIGGVWAENQTIYRFGNISKSSLYGGDASAKLHIGNFVVSAAYSYVNENNRKEGIRLSALSPHTANVQLGYMLNRANYRLNVSIGARYIGAKYFLVQEELEVGDDTISAYYPVDYKGYSIWRLSVNQQFFNSVNVVAGIENLFNYKAPLVSFNSYAGTPRLFFVKMTVKINKLYKKVI